MSVELVLAAHHGALEVEQQARLVAAVVGEVVDGRMLSGRHACYDVVGVEFYAVVAGLGRLVLLAEGAGEVFFCRDGYLGSGLGDYGRGRVVAGEGHQEHVAEVVAAGAAQTVVREAHDAAVTVLVARRVGPCEVAGLRPHLDVAEGNCRAGVAVAVVRRPHEGVCVLVVFRGCFAAAAGEDCGCRCHSRHQEEVSFHSFRLVRSKSYKDRKKVGS